MIEKILDFHIHSKYSRACSPKLELPNIADFCEIKGVDIVTVGDFTHPAWFRHIKENLEEVSKTGIYKIKNKESKTRFILTTEVACIYRHKDKTRRLHLVIFAPSIEVVEKFNAALVSRGAKLAADGRPILGMSAQTVLQIMLEVDPRMMMVPAHAWTPWFAVFGSKSGYNSLEECFDELTPHIRAIETGLSSDPVMNRRLTQLDNIVLISNSDAHSLDHIGREANVFAFKDEAAITYDEIVNIIRTGDKKKFLYTIEFYPEEGMYHVDGHRACKFSCLPSETKKHRGLCPVCKKPLTVGVLYRVDELADRKEKDISADQFISHRYIIPLREVIGNVLEVGSNSKKVDREYQKLIGSLGSEFHILLHENLDNIAKVASYPNITKAIANVRSGNVKLSPGFDGQYGQAEVLPIKEGKSAKQTRLL